MKPWIFIVFANVISGCFVLLLQSQFPKAVPFVLAGWAAWVLGYIISKVLMLRRYNGDQRQHRLANLFIDNVRQKIFLSDIYDFLFSTGWEGPEIRRRIAHALTLIKSAMSPDEYLLAIEIGNSIGRTWDEKDELEESLIRR